VQVIPAGNKLGRACDYVTGWKHHHRSTVVAKATITTGNATATPTGTVVFKVDGGSAQTLPYATRVSASFASIAAGNHSITAAYSGDNA